MVTGLKHTEARMYLHVLFATAYMLQIVVIVVVFCFLFSRR